MSLTGARESVKEFGLTVDTSAAEYRDAKRIVRGASLVEVARYYAKHQMLDLPAKTVSEVYEELLKAKRDEGCSDRYLRDLESRLGKFSREFPKQISAVTGLEIKCWLQALTRERSKADAKEKADSEKSVANRTRNNFRLCIQTLFYFAKAQKYLRPDWNDLAGVPLWKVKQEAVEIFTPEEMSLLLTYAPANLLPFLAIGGFAGLRSAEIERLDWAKVDLESGYITVDAGIAKTNSRRLVPIVPNLKAWLEDYKKPRGPVLELANAVNAGRSLVNATRPVDPSNPERRLAPQVTWRHNALRHSFCSYRLAVVKSAAEVALEAGNSPQMIFRHYRELVSEKSAKAWFDITPESMQALREKAEREQAAKIVAFPAKAAA